MAGDASRNPLRWLVSGDEVHQILVFGLEGAGKTSLLYRLKLPGWQTDDLKADVAALKRDVLQPDGSMGSRDPGYHYEELRGSNLASYGMWDIPGHPAFVRMWPMFYRYLRVSAVLFVVDHYSPLRHNLERINQAREMIRMLLDEDELRECCFWVILNVNYSKDDKPSDEELELERATLEALGVPEIATEAPHAGRFFEASINCAEVSANDAVWENVLKGIRRVLRNNNGTRFRLM